MRWTKHKELSAADLDYLVGSTVIIEMMRNKLVVKFHDEEKVAAPSEMGLRNCNGLYHMRRVGDDLRIHEILFELPADLEAVEQHLTQYKMGL
jgi:hypothetical protein